MNVKKNDVQRTAMAIERTVAIGKSQIAAWDPLEEYDNSKKLCSTIGIPHPRCLTKTELEMFLYSKNAMQELALQQQNLLRYSGKISSEELVSYIERQVIEMPKELTSRTVNHIHAVLTYNAEYFDLDRDDFPKQFQPQPLSIARFQYAMMCGVRYYLFLDNLEEIVKTTVPSTHRVGPSVFKGRCKCATPLDNDFKSLLEERKVMMAF